MDISYQLLYNYIKSYSRRQQDVDKWICRSCSAVFAVPSDAVLLPQCPQCHDYGRKLSKRDWLKIILKDGWSLLRGRKIDKRIYVNPLSHRLNI